MKRPALRLAYLVLVLAVAGCSREPESAPTAPVAAPAEVTPAAPPTESVAAVALGTGTPPLNVRFELGGKPVVGQPVKIALELTAPDALQGTRVQATSTALTIHPAELSVESLAPGVPARHELEITPTAAGLAELLLQVTTQNAGGVQQGSFSIPVLVAAPAGG